MFDIDGMLDEQKRVLEGLELNYARVGRIGRIVNDLIPPECHILPVVGAEYSCLAIFISDHDVDWADEYVLGPIHRHFNCDWSRTVSDSQRLKMSTKVQQVDIDVYACAGDQCRIVATPKSHTFYDYALHCEDENA